MPVSVNGRGRFESPFLDTSGSAPVSTGAPDEARLEFMPKQSCSRRAAARREQFSIDATKSRTLPPRRPPRAVTHEREWHAHTFLSVFTMKLYALLFEAWVGKGQRPRRQHRSSRRTITPYCARAISIETLAFTARKSIHSRLIPLTFH